MIYSPQSRESYVRKTLDEKLVGFGALPFLEEKGAWNLFYLSEPLVDVAYNWTSDDVFYYPRYSSLVWPCALACRVYPQLAEAFSTLPPIEAVNVLKSLDYKILQPYEQLGENWIEIMESRARGPRGVLEQNGNIFKVNFGGHFLSVPADLKSAIIMPLSFKRH